MKFSNPIAAGDGALVVPALKSPNYVAGVSGWQLDRNGDAEFNSVLLRGGAVIPARDAQVVYSGVEAERRAVSFLIDPTAGLAADNVVGELVGTWDSLDAGVARLAVSSPSAYGINSTKPPGYLGAGAGVVIQCEEATALAYAGAWGPLAGFEALHYWKDPAGLVHVKGTGTGGARGGAVSAALPVGYRPAANHACGDFGGTAAGQLVIGPAGVITASAAGPAGFFAIDTSFRPA